MMKLTEIYGVLKAHSDVLKYAQEVASKQRDVKRAAIGCIHCSTVGSGKMLALRTDIERVDRKQA